MTEELRSRLASGRTVTAHMTRVFLCAGLVGCGSPNVADESEVYLAVVGDLASRRPGKSVCVSKVWFGIPDSALPASLVSKVEASGYPTLGPGAWPDTGSVLVALSTLEEDSIGVRARGTLIESHASENPTRVPLTFQTFDYRPSCRGDACAVTGGVLSLRSDGLAELENTRSCGAAARPR